MTTERLTVHIPDNYLSPSTCAVMTVAMVPVWAHSVRTVREELPREKVAAIGVWAAFSFLVMMFNVPLPGGTTGHAVGATLVAILLGPEAACLAISVALALQALLFGDGGVLSFWANCFNMAFVMPYLGYAVYNLMRTHVGGTRGERLGAAIGSYVGINAAALCTAVELGIQPLLFADASGAALFCPYPLGVTIPAMLVPHLTVAGLVEAAVTVLVLGFVRRSAPDLAGEPDAPRHARRAFALAAAVIAATPLGLLATGEAWGEWDAETVSELVGYVPQGMASGFTWESLLPDYSLAGLPEVAGYVLSAVIGVCVLVIAFKLSSAALSKRAGRAA